MLPTLTLTLTQNLGEGIDRTISILTEAPRRHMMARGGVARG